MISFAIIAVVLFFQMQILLQTWPELEPEVALELLDYTYADQEVRKIAVKCIEKMRFVSCFTVWPFFCSLLFSATSFLWSFTLLNYPWIRPLVISEQYCNEFNYLPILNLVYTFRLYSFDLFVQRLRDPTVSSSACPGKQFLSPCKKKSTQASRSVFSFSVIASKRKHKCVAPEDVHDLLAMLVITNSTSHTFL